MKTIINKTFTLFLLFCCLFGVFGCNNQIGQSSQDIFDNKDITIEFLKENNALFYENIVFLSNENNHVYKIKDDKIVDHVKYPLINFNIENYDKVIGMDIFKAVEYIGCPTYLGNISDSSIDYSDYDGYLRRVYLDKKDNQYFIKRIEKLSKYDKFYESFTDIDAPNPSIEDVKKLKVGMCIDDVIKTLKNKLNYNCNPNPSFGHPWIIMTKEGVKINLNIGSADAIDCDHIHFNEKIAITHDYFYLYGYFSEDNTIAVTYNPSDCEPYFDKNDVRFSSSNITLQYLKDNNCFFFKDYVFVSDSKNHVFKIKDDKIIAHDVYEKVSYPRNPIDLFSRLDGAEFSSTFEALGIPLFMDNSKNSDRVNYVLQNGYMMTADIVEKDGILVYDYLSGNNATWAFTDLCFKDDRDDYVDKEKLNLIKKDMCVAEVTSIIGKAIQIKYFDDTKMSYKFTYPLVNNEKLEIVFVIKRIEKNCEHAYKYEDIGLNKNDGSFGNNAIVMNNMLYLYVDSINVA